MVLLFVTGNQQVALHMEHYEGNNLVTVMDLGYLGEPSPKTNHRFQNTAQGQLLLQNSLPFSSSSYSSTWPSGFSSAPENRQPLLGPQCGNIMCVPTTATGTDQARIYLRNEQKTQVVSMGKLGPWPSFLTKWRWEMHLKHLVMGLEVDF